VDGTAVFGVIDGDGLPRALVTSDDERVVEWVDETIDAYRADAEPLDASMFVS
jgi:hypothetical protein